jgi:hypothetical protein
MGGAFTQTLTACQATAARTLDGATDAAVGALSDVRAAGEASLQQLVDQLRELLQALAASCRRQTAEQAERLEAWGQLQASAGALASEIKTANAFLGLTLDPQALALIGKDAVILLLRRVIAWCEQRTWLAGQMPVVSLQRLYVTVPREVDDVVVGVVLTECITALIRGQSSG